MQSRMKIAEFMFALGDAAGSSLSQSMTSPNQAPQRNDRICHASCVRRLRARHGRG
jgi:hypothetical protein